MDNGILNFKKNGWIVERRIFNKSEINTIKSKINLFLEKNINKYSGRDINFFHKKIAAIQFLRLCLSRS